LNRISVSRGAGRGGFTLIEMLVVIAIIGVLAALIINGGPAATEKRVRSRVKVEMTALENAIDSYKQKQGFYPPDNPANSASNSLFYELVGTVKEGAADKFDSPLGQAPLDSATINSYFGAGGFINAVVRNPADPKEVPPNYYKNLKSRQFTTNGAGVVFLIVPYKGPANPNVWHYRLAGSSPASPIHNPDSYDLWAEVLIGNKKVMIGNWKD
jgi:prepilin-type N-terminal cleavage/methylation domain-containing protein